MNHPPPTRASRETITLDTIEAAILHLIEAGKPASEPNIRKLIGGSPNTILPLIARWYEQRGADFLAGRISVVQSSDLPRAAHDLIAELRADARRAADADVASAVEAATAKAAEAEAAIAALRSRESEFQAKKDTLEQVQADLRADIAMTRADATAARAAADAAATDRREAIAAREAAEAMTRDAERREQRTQEALRASEEALASAKQRLGFAQAEISGLRAAAAEKEAAHAKASAEATATITSLRESIEEIKTAHLREIQALRANHSDAASRWAEARTKLEKQAADLAKVANDAVGREAVIVGQLEQAKRAAEAAAEKEARLSADLEAAIKRAIRAEESAEEPAIAHRLEVENRLQRLEERLAVSTSTKKENEC